MEAAEQLGQPVILGAEGIDLLGEVPARPIVVETPRNGVDVTFFAYAVNDGSWRLIYDVYGNTTELYDLASDPLELHNLGLTDHSPATSVWLVEWPDRGGALLPPATLRVRLALDGSARRAGIEAAASLEGRLAAALQNSP